MTKHYTLLEEKIFDIFVKPGEILEVRIVKVWGKSSAWKGFTKSTVSGYFDNYLSFNECVRKAIQNQQANIYFTLQVINPRLIGRAYNRLKATDLTTSDKNAMSYRWIPIDIDPERPADVSATASALRKSIELRDMIRDWIVDTTDYAAPITAISGNGAHILIRLPEDLPVNDDSKKYVKSFLENVYEEFSTNNLIIDTSVYNPSRIWKLYGSKAMKGDEVPVNEYREALEHRESYIDDLGGVCAL
jgi:hypothetical protein